MAQIFITGSRDWDNENIIELAFLNHKINYPPSKSITIIHGNAKGADKQSDKIAKELGYNIKRFPAEWDKYHNAAGPIRNAQMVNLLTKNDLIMVFHDNLKDSKGTGGL